MNVSKLSALINVSLFLLRAFSADKTSDIAFLTTWDTREQQQDYIINYISMQM